MIRVAHCYPITSALPGRYWDDRRRRRA